MLISEHGFELDEMDRNILKLLQQEGRIRNADLAQRVNLSPPACLARVRRLEESGLIDGYVALLNRRKLGIDNLCFIELSLQLHQHEKIQAVLDEIMAMDEVLECHHLTGEYDYLLKVAVTDTQALEQFISGRLIPLPGVAKLHTSLVLKEIKSVTRFALSR